MAGERNDLSAKTNRFKKRKAGALNALIRLQKNQETSRAGGLPNFHPKKIPRVEGLKDLRAKSDSPDMTMIEANRRQEKETLSSEASAPFLRVISSANQ
jgi:hypothetical protein